MSDGINGRLISIGIPTYNRAADLERAIASALSQDYESFEVVVSDNGSTDDTERICKELSAHDQRLRYFRQPTNLGAAENFRLVLAHSRGEFFMWLGDDDWIDSTYLSQCAKILISDQECSLVSGLCRYYRAGKYLEVGEELDLTTSSGAMRLLSYYSRVARNGSFYGLMRKDLISRIPIPNVLAGDWLMIAAMAYWGTIRTVPTTSVNRSIGGHSSEWDRLLAMFTLSAFQKTYPYLTIAAIVFSDIAWKSPVYSDMGSVQRRALAALAAGTIVKRHHSARQAIQILRDLVRSADERGSTETNTSDT